MDQGSEQTTWSFFTNHGRVLLCIAGNSEMRLREIADSVGITERSVHAIVGDLQQSGFVDKVKQGRRNNYSIRRDRALPRQFVSHCSVGMLLAALGL